MPQVLLTAELSLQHQIIDQSDQFMGSIILQEHSYACLLVYPFWCFCAFSTFLITFSAYPSPLFLLCFLFPFQLLNLSKSTLSSFSIALEAVYPNFIP